MRKKAAVAINNNLERAAEESGNNKVKAVEVGIKEEKTDQGDTASKLEQTVRVAKEGSE